MTMLRLLSYTLLMLLVFFTLITVHLSNSNNLLVITQTEQVVTRDLIAKTEEEAATRGNVTKSNLQIFNRSIALKFNMLLRRRNFYRETPTSYKTILDKESEYKMKLSLLTPEDLSILKRNRNITLQWSKKLLPPSPRLSLQCLRHRDKARFRDETRNEARDEARNEARSLTVSVIIVYYNEDIMLLLRTLTTLVYRTPHLLQVLLIDDCSEGDNSEEITRYAEGVGIPVRLSRNTARQGIANSRLQGIHRAQGDVIVILDSHMEVGEGWLSPLLEILTRRRRALAVPRVKLRNEEEGDDDDLGELYTVELEHGYGIVQLGPLHIPLPGEETTPFLTPALLGGAFAGHREYLVEIYPQGLTGRSWGVENSRVSLRSWLCGQGIYTAPCSLVSHTNGPDRTLARYFRDNPNLMSALKREVMAEVVNLVCSEEERGKMVSRLENLPRFRDEVFEMFREIRAGFAPGKHQCRDYQWYTDNVMTNYQPMDSRDSLYVGEVRSHSIRQNGVYALCLQLMVYTVVMYTCREQSLVLEDSHVLQLTNDYRVRMLNGRCWVLDDSTDREDRAYIKFGPCDTETKGQQWKYNEERMWIVHIASNRCLDGTGLEATDEVYVTKCNIEREGQRWNIHNAPWF